jgi:hypothetical protein
MKRLLLLLLLISNLSFAQFFNNQEENLENDSDFPQPERAFDDEGESPPAEAPIEDYLIYLTLLGVLIGVMVHNSKTKMRV